MNKPEFCRMRRIKYSRIFRYKQIILKDRKIKPCESLKKREFQPKSKLCHPGRPQNGHQRKRNETST